MTQTELAEALGVAQPTVAGYVARGCPLTTVDEARDWLDMNLQWRRRKGVKASPAADGQAAQRWSGTAMSVKLQTARLQREQAEAELARLRADELAGILVRAVDVQRAHARRLIAARDTLLNLPARLAAVIAAESDATMVFDMLTDGMHQVLAVLSAPDFAGVEQDGAAP